MPQRLRVKQTGRTQRMPRAMVPSLRSRRAELAPCDLVASLPRQPVIKTVCGKTITGAAINAKLDDLGTLYRSAPVTTSGEA